METGKCYESRLKIFFPESQLFFTITLLRHFLNKSLVLKYSFQSLLNQSCRGRILIYRSFLEETTPALGGNLIISDSFHSGYGSFSDCGFICYVCSAFPKAYTL